MSRSLEQRVADLEALFDKCKECGKVCNFADIYARCDECSQNYLPSGKKIPEGSIRCRECHGEGGRDVGYYHYQTDWKKCGKCNGKGYVSNG